MVSFLRIVPTPSSIVVSFPVYSIPSTAVLEWPTRVGIRIILIRIWVLEFEYLKIVIFNRTPIRLWKIRIFQSIRMRVFKKSQFLKAFELEYSKNRVIQTCSQSYIQKNCSFRKYPNSDIQNLCAFKKCRIIEKISTTIIPFDLHRFLGCL